MILIVDSGSTKTDWTFLNGQEVLHSVKTQGINPFHLQKRDIDRILQSELLPETESIDNSSVSELYYYGAGCATNQVCQEMKELLNQYFPNADICVESDMLGAARALCGHSEGVACVLGTGSNSCLYDGRFIADNVPSLGYILGDEGSSSDLGKRLLADCLKRQLPEAVAREFMERYNLTMDTILENVYRKPMANRYMADFTPFLGEKRNVPEVHHLLTTCFAQFLRRNVMNYHKPWLPVNFVGSLAYTFREELSEAAESLGLSLGKIMKSPMEGLILYHTTSES